MEDRETIDWVDERTWLKARAIDVTSTEVASLFGHGRETAFELACRKDGKTESKFESTERTEIGKEIEWAIAQRAARLFGVSVRHKNEYMRIHSARMGASFDYEITGVTDYIVDDNRLRRAFGAMGPGLLEVKNVDSLIFKNQWTFNHEGEADEAPIHIELQLQAQLEVSTLSWGVIVAFVGGNRVEIILRLRDEKIGFVIRSKVERFWKNLAKGEYPPVSLPEDLDILKVLNGYAEPGKIMDARGNEEIGSLLAAYIKAHDDETRAKYKKETAQGKLLQLIGNAERVVADNATLSCGMIGPCDISYTRKGYRNFKVTQRKGKK